MSANLAALLYLVSGVFFVFALRGPSSPASSRRDHPLGMAGMAIAIVTTLASKTPSGVSAWLLVIGGIAIGGGLGAVLARRIEMTRIPQLAAVFQSLVGLAAVLVAAGALFAPQSLGIGAPGAIRGASLLEMSVGAAIGAVSFAGSVIAFARLDGRMSGAPILLPRRHPLNIGLAVLLVVMIGMFVTTESHFLFLLLAFVAFAIGVTLIIPIAAVDMPIVAPMLNSCSGWAVAGIGFMLGNIALIITGALVGASGAMRSCAMCTAKNRSLVSLFLGDSGAGN